VRALQVKCDRTRPACTACIRLKVQCPGYDDATKPRSQEEVGQSADSILRASGVVKRRIGSCAECRRAKTRCSHTHPKCDRCNQKGTRCTYPERRERPLLGTPISPSHSQSTTDVVNNTSIARGRSNSHAIIAEESPASDTGGLEW